ncbi:hypothetical protein GCK32_014125 [Trichostrongylus colubriformis]|uniref:Uncharacterized protein n=1 Tax=Trichostrongylus colubriformis TaxID=6319 RepID=A0AAN8GDC4_TRICO
MMLLASYMQDRMMQAANIKYDIIGMAETRWHGSPHFVYETGAELSLGAAKGKIRPFSSPMHYHQATTRAKHIIANGGCRRTDNESDPNSRTGID